MSGVTVDQKKEFIRWFLNNYQLRKREGVWILNYLLSNDKFLKKVHFVENANKTPRGIIMTTHCVNDFPLSSLRYYRNGEINTNAESCFHDIRLNRDDDLYVELNFKDKHNCKEYWEVLEENPFDEPDTSEFEEQAVHFLDYCLYEFKVEQLKKRIDEAIDDGDKELFMKLTDELGKIEKVKKKFKTVNKKGVLN
jgi:uncharacterized protein YpiB (UPF0302 family)